jgi:hypothetical protein
LNQWHRRNSPLFKCPLVVFVWSFVSEALGWKDYPTRSFNFKMASRGI